VNTTALLLLGALSAPDPSPRLELEPVSLPAPENSGLLDLFASDGGILLSWVELGGDARRLRVARREGEGWSEPRTVVEDASMRSEPAGAPRIAALADGTLAAAWTVETGRGSWDVYVSVSTDAGEEWTEPRALHEQAGRGEHGFLSLVALDDERFLAAWLDGRERVEDPTAPTALLSRTIDREGGLGPERVIDESACDCCRTGLVRTRSGHVLAAWRDRGKGELRDIALARRTDRGWTPGVHFVRDGWTTFQCPVNGPAIDGWDTSAALGWYTEGGGKPTVRVAWADARTGERGRVFDVASEGALGNVDVALVDRERFAVTWLEAAGEGAVWRLGLYDASGPLVETADPTR
jgi:hypothetical protein